MSSKNYVPRNDAHFIEWAENLLEITAERYETWSVASPITVIGTTFADRKSVV